MLRIIQNIKEQKLWEYNNDCNITLSQTPKNNDIQVHKKKLYHEKSQYFLSLISESETHILYRFITHRVKYLKNLFLEILMIMAYR